MLCSFDAATGRDRAMWSNETTQVVIYDKGARCAFCGEDGSRLDQHDRCEQCVLDAEKLAARPLDLLEKYVARGREYGLSAAQLREAFEMTLAGADGLLSGTIVGRRAKECVWLVEPLSVFVDNSGDDFPREPNEIAALRRHVGWSVERLAARMGVAPTELALWEHGKIPPRRSAMELADMFGVALDCLLGCRDWRDPLECARCGTDAPRNRERYQQGWDVAGGVDLVCPDCLTPGDLEWPSDAEA